MNKIMNKIKMTGMVAIASLAFSGCDLDLLPLNEVVLENYWTEKSDVESVVNSCYAAFEQYTGDNKTSPVLDRMFVWGELRSDNVVQGKTSQTDIDYILNGNLLQSNPYTTWTCFYDIINKCNTVLYYAPGVQQKDPNYTESDLAKNEAEVTALRALCYFYLIRAFKDVPYVTNPSIDDDQNYYVAATSHEDVLDSLITDLEAVRENVPRKYSTETDNLGRVTRNMVYALLADMYLWRASNANVSASAARADYQSCIDYCDKIIDYKIEQYETDEFGNLKQQISSTVYQYYGYPLISETSGEASSTLTSANAYRLIFGNGNSFESIFELQYVNNQTAKNNLVAEYFGNFESAGAGYCAANDEIMTSEPTRTYDNDNVNIFTYYDFRGSEDFKYSEGGAFPITKYACTSVNVGTGTSWAGGQENNYTYRSIDYSNWIVYRLTDIMLMKAEAEVQLAGYLSTTSETQSDTTATTGANLRKASGSVTGNVYSTAQEYYDDAFNIVSAVYYRSCPAARTSTTGGLVQSNFSSQEDYTDLVEVERRRELMFEGKRYFDLVRRARREGNTSHLANSVAGKYTSNAALLSLKLKQMDYMYMPYNKSEVETNTNLKQNPAYYDDEKSIKN